MENTPSNAGQHLDFHILGQETLESPSTVSTLVSRICEDRLSLVGTS